eukprot:2881371-Rhodomonas_salina.1
MHVVSKACRAHRVVRGSTEDKDAGGHRRHAEASSGLRGRRPDGVGQVCPRPRVRVEDVQVVHHTGVALSRKDVEQRTNRSHPTRISRLGWLPSHGRRLPRRQLGLVCCGASVCGRAPTA